MNIDVYKKVIEDYQEKVWREVEEYNAKVENYRVQVEDYRKDLLSASLEPNKHTHECLKND